MFQMSFMTSPLKLHSIILLVIQCGRGWQEGMNTRRQESLGAILDVDYPSILLIYFIYSVSV